jgi:hypothetical protein
LSFNAKYAGMSTSYSFPTPGVFYKREFFNFRWVNILDI